MSEYFQGFTTTQMPTVAWHGGQKAVVHALKSVAYVAEIVGDGPDIAWAVAFDRLMHEDDAAGVIAAAALLGCGDITPIGLIPGVDGAAATVKVERGELVVCPPARRARSAAAWLADVHQILTAQERLGALKR